MVDLDKYKIEISLPDFMQLNGFRPDEGSSRSNPKLKNQETGEVYIIKKNANGYYTYWSPHNDLEKGKTIIDFIIERYNVPIISKKGQNVVSILENYIRSKDFVLPSNSEYRPDKDAQNFKKTYESLEPLVDKSFFNERKIKDEILNHPYFKGIIFNNTYERDDLKFVNVAFLMHGIGGVEALSIRSNKFKGCLGEKASAICASINYDKNLDKLFLCESMIDGMSHFQMNFEELKNNSVRYLSTEGSITNDQIDLINKAIKIQKPKEIISCFDNDLVGEYYTANVLGRITTENIEFDEKTVNFQESVVHVYRHDEKKEGKMEITFFTRGDYDGRKKLELLESQVKTINNKYRNVLVEGDLFSLTVGTVGKNTSTAMMTFPNLKECWVQASAFLLELRLNNSISFLRERSREKDFNDDLRLK